MMILNDERVPQLMLIKTSFQESRLMNYKPVVELLQIT